MNVSSPSRLLRLLALVAGIVLACMVLLSAAPGGLGATEIDQADSPDAAQKVTSVLRATFAGDPTAKTRYLVLLDQQADVENDIVDWKAKGRYVLDRLRAVADATQPQVIELLNTQIALGNVESFESYYIVNGLQVTGNLASVRAISTIANVSTLDVFPMVTLDQQVAHDYPQAPDAANAVDWNVALVHAPQAWAKGYNGAGVTVGSIDTGVRYTHEALVQQYRGYLGPNSFTHDYNWWDAVGTSPVPIDPANGDLSAGHGSHTMGTLVGAGAGNGIGVAPGAKWIASNGVVAGTDTTTGADIIESAEFMLAPWDHNKQNPDPDKRPVVVANSWGWGNSVPYPGCITVEFFHEVIRAWRAAGIFPSFSSGNAMGPLNRPPAAYPDTFETGGLRNPSLANVFASYNSQGPSCYDGGQLPQLMAGGGDAGIQYEDLVRSASNTADTEYKYQAGTSMAQPATAGAVTILKGINPNLTITQTWYILTSTTSFDPTWASCGPRPNICYGWGLLQIDAAVDAALLTLGTATPTLVIATATRTATASATRTATRTTVVTSTATRTRTAIATSTAMTATLTRTSTATMATVTATSTPTATRTAALATATRTPIPSTLTATATLIPHSATGTRTVLAVTATSISATATNTSVVATATGTVISSSTPTNGTPTVTTSSTATNTATVTGTSIAAVTTTSTASRTTTAAASSTATRTRTPVPATGTQTSPTATHTLPPTITHTVLPTATAPASAIATQIATSTLTSSPVVRPATGTATHTSVMLTATSTATSPPAASTVTSTRSVTPAPPATGTTTLCSIAFSDVQQQDYFYDGVLYLSCRGAISGYADNTFRPYNNATRAQLVKIVVIAAGLPLQAPQTPTFGDVPTGFPFYSYIETAVGAGLIVGYSDDTFKPYNRVTRGQIAKIVVSAAGWPVFAPFEPTFSDVTPDSPFYGFVETAFSHGIVSGYEDGTFRWQNEATRGQIAKIARLALGD